MTRTAVKQEVYEIVQAMPGVTSGEVVELMPHVKKQSVYAALNVAFTMGLMTRDGRPAKWHWVEGKPVPPVRGIKPSSRPKWDVCVPNSVENSYTEAQILRSGEAVLGRTNAELIELRQWKADAIARYPDLAVDPLVLKARRIVAQTLRDSGDANMAEVVERGTMDHKPLMKVALAALESV